MQLDDIVAQVRDQLAGAAALGDDRVREVAATLAGAATPAVRLALMTALSAAADEISAALLDLPGSPAVSVRLDGEQLHVGVTVTQPEATASSRAEEGEATARISLRLSDALKSDVDAAAARDGVSVNTWLVRAATSALSPTRGTTWERRGTTSHRVTGWIDG